MTTAAKTVAADAPLRFESSAAWAAWLGAHHDKSPGVWLRLAKKGAPDPLVSKAEALDLALCYGWIDARNRSDGPLYWLQRFTPRSPRSIWSKTNRDKALRLIAEGRMQPAGQAEIERARRDGRWEAAYDAASTSTVPLDLQVALDASKKAKAFFATLDAKNRYAVMFRLQTARRAETRERRLRQFVEMLARGEKLHP